MISCVVNLVLAARLNAPLGEWSDVYLYFLGGSVADSIQMIMLFIPISIIMAKIIVPGIEGTMHALQSTIIHVSYGMLRQQVGIVINHVFFGICNKTIQFYYKLLALELLAKLIPFLYIYRLIPSKEEVDRLQEKYI